MEVTPLRRLPLLPQLHCEVEKPLLTFRGDNFKKDLKKYDHHIADLRKQLASRHAGVEKVPGFGCVFFRLRVQRSRSPTSGGRWGTPPPTGVTGGDASCTGSGEEPLTRLSVAGPESSGRQAEGPGGEDAAAGGETN